MWDFPEKFKTDSLLIWPVYVNFNLDEWDYYERAYAAQAYLAAERTLMINSISKKPKSHGGAFYFAGGKIIQKLVYNQENILVVEA